MPATIMKESAIPPIKPIKKYPVIVQNFNFEQILLLSPGKQPFVHFINYSENRILFDPKKHNLLFAKFNLEVETFPFTIIASICSWL